MKVKVVPKRPISGILPKNKWIDSEMELDLNKAEIARCMQYGSVYDMSGNVIVDINKSGKIAKYDEAQLKSDNNNIKKEYNKLLFDNFGPVVMSDIKPKEVESVMTVSEGEPVVIDMGGKLPEGPVFVTGMSVEEKEEIVSELEVLSCKKEDNYILLEVQFNSTDKLENVYGLFNVISGSRPVMEYKKEDNWVKFSNKFNQFSELNDGDKLIFRFVPKNESTIKYKLSIKKGNDLICLLEEKINPEEL